MLGPDCCKNLSLTGSFLLEKFVYGLGEVQNTGLLECLVLLKRVYQLVDFVVVPSTAASKAVFFSGVIGNTRIVFVVIVIYFVGSIEISGGSLAILVSRMVTSKAVKLDIFVSNGGESNRQNISQHFHLWCLAHPILQCGALLTLSPWMLGPSDPKAYSGAIFCVGTFLGQRCGSIQTNRKQLLVNSLDACIRNGPQSKIHHSLKENKKY